VCARGRALGHGHWCTRWTATDPPRIRMQGPGSGLARSRRRPNPPRAVALMSCDIPGHLGRPRPDTVADVTDDFTPEWDTLLGLALARDELRAIRDAVWRRALLPTEESLHVDRITPTERGWSVEPAGDVMMFEMAVVTTMPDRHDIESSVRLLLSHHGWRVETEVNALNDAVTILWEGPAATGTSRGDMAPALLAAAREVVKSTLALDVLEGHSPE
jgi:hypothetical protein